MMKTPFAGVTSLAQPQVCGQSFECPWPGGQGQVWMGMERPKAAPPLTPGIFQLG